jgi:hypothetical protein
MVSFLTTIEAVTFGPIPFCLISGALSGPNNEEVKNLPMADRERISLVA